MKCFPGSKYDLYKTSNISDMKCVLLLANVIYFSNVGYSLMTTSRYVTNNTECRVKPEVTFVRKETFPNPQLDVDFDYCGRRCQKSWICDPTHILTLQQGDFIDHKLKDIGLSDTCGCSPCTQGLEGYKVAIALVRTMSPPDSGTEKLDERALEFASYLRGTKWKYGSCENDAVIFVSTNDSLVQTATGYITRKILDQQCLQKIQNETEVLLEQGKVSGALSYIVTRLGQVFRFKSCDPPPHQQDSTNIMLIAIMGSLAALFVVFMLSCFLHRQGYCRKEQRYGINLPPMTLTVRKPHKHRKHGRNNKLPTADLTTNNEEGSIPDGNNPETQRLQSD